MLQLGDVFGHPLTYRFVLSKLKSFRGPIG